MAHRSRFDSSKPINRTKPVSLNEDFHFSCTGSGAVPMFFMFSGYYFFNGVKNFDSKTYATKIKRRIWTLIVPYLSWILIAITARCIVDLMSGKSFELSDYLGWNFWHLFWDYHRWDESSFNWLGLPTPMTGPYVVPLWFLRDLIIVSLLSPLVYWVVRFTRHYGICLLACLYVSGIWFDIQGLRISTVFFFSVGAYMSLHGKNLIEQAARARVSSYFVTAILFIAMTWCCGRGTKIGTLLSPFYIIIAICAILNLSAYLVGSGKVKIIPLLTKSTFFVYASHMILILGFSSWVLTIALGNSFLIAIMAKYFATPLLTVAISVGLYALISRFAPSLSKNLTETVEFFPPKWRTKPNC